MSHIHIPDGVLPWWLWLGGWLVTAALLGLASRRAMRAGSRRAVPIIGAVSALVLVSMSSEIVPIAYHVNLTVIAGVLLGPWLGMISAFIVVLVLALLGHGGITVVGLNTLVIATEIALGWAFVRGGTRVFGIARVRPVAVISTVLTLAITTTMLVGIVALAGTGATTRETGALDSETLEFRNPFSGGLFSIPSSSAIPSPAGCSRSDCSGTGMKPERPKRNTIMSTRTLMVMAAKTDMTTPIRMTGRPRRTRMTRTPMAPPCRCPGSPRSCTPSARSVGCLSRL